MRRRREKMDQRKQEELTKFFEAIFEGTEGYIDIRTLLHVKKGEKIETIQKDHFFRKTTELKDLVRTLSNENFIKGKNVHFGVAPRAKTVEGVKQTGSENDIKIINCFSSDIDCRREKHPELPTKEEKIKEIEKFELPPSIITDSGLGYQTFWLLKAPIEIKNRKMFFEIKGILKGLAMALGGDPAGHDLCRLLRVPLSRNYKPECPKEGLEVKIIKFEPTLKYGPGKFKKFMVKIEDLPGVDIDIKDVKIPERFNKLLKRNKKLQNTYLKRNRPDLKDQTGSGYDMALVNILIKHKFSDSEIAAIIKSSKTGTEKKITPSYLAITIRKGRAFEKARKEKNELKITAGDFRPTDLWNSESFCKKWEGQLLYCKMWNSWLVYREGRWQTDDKNETQELAKKIIMDYYRQASEIIDDKERKRLVNQALKSESQRAIRAMTDLATSTLPAVPDDFDQDIYILNLKNGTMDLKTLEFRNHKPEDMLMKIARVNYEPGADCPKWLAF
ncbi:hypothetical protein ES695_00070, partial [Candidatus Atribacteria bacterium 1244-E10-H5-B2]